MVPENKLGIIKYKAFFIFTCKLRHCEFFHLKGSRSLMPVIVPMYLQGRDYTYLKPYYVTKKGSEVGWANHKGEHYVFRHPHL